MAIDPIMVEITFAALCCWREDRSGNNAERLAQLSCIRNRVKAHWVPENKYQDVVCQPWQFSAMTAKGDPNLIKFPKSDGPNWIQILTLAESIVVDMVQDSVGGACFYFSAPITEPPHAWGNVEKTVDVGALHFYKSVR